MCSIQSYQNANVKNSNLIVREKLIRFLQVENVTPTLTTRVASGQQQQQLANGTQGGNGLLEENGSPTAGEDGGGSKLPISTS
jgi:hypothetical protein